jgi:hypothetical protein
MRLVSLGLLRRIAPLLVCAVAALAAGNLASAPSAHALCTAKQWDADPDYCQEVFEQEEPAFAQAEAQRRAQNSSGCTTNMKRPPAYGGNPDCYFLARMSELGVLPANLSQTEGNRAIGVAQQACTDMLADTTGGDVPLNWALRYTAQNPELRPSDQTVSAQVAGLTLTAAVAYCPSVLS